VSTSARSPAPVGLEKRERSANERSAVARLTQPGQSYQLALWLVEDFFDFFFAWRAFEVFFFFVLVIGAVEVEVSGVIVCPPPVPVWA
jgi:hypothetical protein